MRSRSTSATSTGATRKVPARLPRMAPNTLGESKRGTHIQSTAPPGETSAETSPSLRKPKSPIGTARLWLIGPVSLSLFSFFFPMGQASLVCRR